MPWTHFADLDVYNAFIAKLQVAKWPPSGTTRTDCNFRMALGEGLPFPRPQRFLLHLRGVPDEPMGFAYPVIDMEVSGVFELHGTSGVNEFGRSVELDIIQHLLPDFPGSPWDGIEYHFTFKMDGFDDWNTTFYWESGNLSGVPCEIPMKADFLTTTCPVVFVIEDFMLLNVDWPSTPAGATWEFRPMSACYVFPEESPLPGMAEFNGVDAYIALDHDVTELNLPFVIDAEVRLHDIVKHWPLMGRFNAGGFVGMEGPFLIFGSLKQFTPFVPVLNEWFNWRLEFEQQGQLRLQLFIDDVEMSDNIINRFNTPINRLGVWRHTQVIEIFGHLDVRTLKVLTGNAPSTTVTLDMPLETDACDIGPDLNHGTTFNMTLPSC